MAWRGMEHADLAAVERLSAEIHPGYPEDAAIVEERLRLYPRGCFIAMSGADRIGYAITHPWLADAAPSLNTLIGAIPSASGTYYIHDVAVLATHRAQGH